MHQSKLPLRTDRSHRLCYRRPFHRVRFVRSVGAVSQLRESVMDEDRLLHVVLLPGAGSEKGSKMQMKKKWMLTSPFLVGGGYAREEDSASKKETDNREKRNEIDQKSSRPSQEGRKEGSCKKDNQESGG